MHCNGCSTDLLVEVLRALDIFGLGFTSLVASPKDGDDGGVACTAATTGNVAVTPRRLELLLGLLGVGVVDIIGENCGDLRTFAHQTLVTHGATRTPYLGACTTATSDGTCGWAVYGTATSRS